MVVVAFVVVTIVICAVITVVAHVIVNIILRMQLIIHFATFCQRESGTWCSYQAMHKATIQHILCLGFWSFVLLCRSGHDVCFAWCRRLAVPLGMIRGQPKRMLPGTPSSSCCTTVRLSQLRRCSLCQPPNHKQLPTAASQTIQVLFYSVTQFE